MSYAGRMTFGLIADRTPVPDLDVLKDGIATSLFELATLLLRTRRRERTGAAQRRGPNERDDEPRGAPQT